VDIGSVVNSIGGSEACANGMDSCIYDPYDVGCDVNGYGGGRGTNGYDWCWRRFECGYGYWFGVKVLVLVQVQVQVWVLILIQVKVLVRMYIWVRV